MTYLLVQIALWLLGAYVLGAILGCVFRRLHDYALGGDQSTGPAVAAAAAAGAQPTIEVSKTPATSTGDQLRFERALSHGRDADGSGATPITTAGAATLSDASSTKPDTTDAVVLETPTFSPVDEPKPAPPTPSMVIDTTAEAAPSDPATTTPAASATPASTTSSDDVADEGQPFTAVSIAAAAAAAAVAARAAQEAATDAHQKTTTDPVPTTQAAPIPDVAPPPADPIPDAATSPDALTRIKGIDATVERALNEAGVSRYSQIANWQPDDVSEVDAFLEAPGRVSRENWIEQAQILGSGGSTAFSRDVDARSDGKADGAVPAPDATAATAETAPDKAAQQVASTATATAAIAAAAVATATTAAVVTASEKAPAAPAPEPEVAIPDEVGSDALNVIVGIDDKIAGSLNANGITRFEQIANWTGADINHFEALFGPTGLIGRENWVRQAGYLARGEKVPKYLLGPTLAPEPAPSIAASATGAAGLVQPVSIPADAEEPVAAPVTTEVETPPAATQPAADDSASNTASQAITGIAAAAAVASASAVSSSPEAPADAAPSSSPATDGTNLLGMRSVRSAALRGPGRAFQSDDIDDLKRIRGVGVMIENKLNAMGVSSYEQVANWTDQDIDRISQQLEFKGRIQRENWVEQARILASGGHTEFSRRIDRSN